jgi:long-chain acyl-CoA synthetase
MQKAVEDLPKAKAAAWHDGQAFSPAPANFLTTAKMRGEAPAYFVRAAEKWEATSWNSFAGEVRAAARALIALGVQPGDAVCIFSFNRPEWVIMDIAAMMAGAVPAGIYFTSSPQEAAYILNHSQCEVVIVQGQEQFGKIARERASLNRLKHVVMMKGAEASGPLQMSWDDFISKGESRFDMELERRLAAIQPDDTGTLIYTSGTTGPPKAVELSHQSLALNARYMIEVVKASQNERILSYLPLAHIAEQMITIHFQTVNGNAVYFAKSIEELGQHLKEVRPTLFFGVPRVFEKIESSMREKLAQATGIKAKLAAWAFKVGREWHDTLNADRVPGPMLRARKKLASKLIHRKVKDAIGLGEARMVIGGAAPMPPSTLQFFNQFDCPIREVWGLSESCGGGTLNTPGHTRIGSVGKPVPGIEVKLTPEGEICLRGPAIFKGYAKDPEATAHTLADGWLHTGDLGTIDKDGYVYIIGRKKDIIITAGGKNIAPANIEADLVALPLVEHAVVVGDNKPYLIALLTLDPLAVKRFAEDHGLNEKTLNYDRDLRPILQAGIDAINEKHARVQNIRKFAILPERFSIDTGDLTPTMKVKRSSITKRLQGTVDALYAS